MGLLRRVASVFGSRERRSPAIVALDANPVQVAQILILFRMVLADGFIRNEEMVVFENICREQFGIGPEDLPELHAYLESKHSEFGSEEITRVLERLDFAGRARLIELMAKIARSDRDRDVYENRLMRDTAKALGVTTPEER